MHVPLTLILSQGERVIRKITLKTLKHLHLDISDGCTAKLLLGAVASLGVPLSAIKKSLQQIGFESELELSADNLLLLTFTGAENEIVYGQAIEIIRQSSLPVLLQATAQKSLTFFHDNKRPISKQSFAQVVAFSSLILELDPANISASDLPASCDDVLLAVLKNFVSSFGADLPSQIIQQSLSTENASSCQAIWCEPAAISTHEFDRTFAGQVMESRKQITAILGPRVNKNALILQLKNIGAEHIYLQNVNSSEDIMRQEIQLSCVADLMHAEDVVKSLLVQAEASFVSSCDINIHVLHKRTVLVPIGSSQKLRTCKVVEHQFGDEVVRAEVDEADLFLLTQECGFSQDSVRSDVLATWKRWRTGP